MNDDSQWIGWFQNSAKRKNYLLSVLEISPGFLQVFTSDIGKLKGTTYSEVVSENKVRKPYMVVPFIFIYIQHWHWLSLHPPRNLQLCLLRRKKTKRAPNIQIAKWMNHMAPTQRAVNSYSVGTLEGNGKRTPGKGRRVNFPDNKDCSPAKLKFKTGRVVEVKSENYGPRRLRFRRGRVLGENQDTKSDVLKRSFSKRSFRWCKWYPPRFKRE